jgi:hypothetical protein
MDWTLEVVMVPVGSQNGGFDRAIAFYRDQRFAQPKSDNPGWWGAQPGSPRDAVSA